MNLINDSVYVVADTETTGLDVAGEDRICEIAAVGITADGYQSSCFEQLVDPGIPIPPEASAIHHITDRDVSGKPTPAGAIAEMVETFAAQIYVAHNAEFDSTALRIPDSIWLCTHRLALHLWPEAPGHGNQLLRYWLELEVDLPEGLYPHRAAYDTLCTAALFRRQLAEVRRRWPEITTVEGLQAAIDRPVLLHRVPFSKHRGQLWADMDPGFLEWVIDRDFSKDILHTAQHYLDRTYQHV